MVKYVRMKDEGRKDDESSFSLQRSSRSLHILHGMAESKTMSIPQSSGLVKSLGLFDSTTLVMGSMIGSGVFIVAADVSRQVQSPGLFFLTWVISGLMTVIAAISYGELAA